MNIFSLWCENVRFCWCDHWPWNFSFGKKRLNISECQRFHWPFSCIKETITLCNRICYVGATLCIVVAVVVVNTGSHKYITTNKTHNLNHRWWDIFNQSYFIQEPSMHCFFFQYISIRYFLCANDTKTIVQNNMMHWSVYCRENFLVSLFFEFIFNIKHVNV